LNGLHSCLVSWMLARSLVSDCEYDHQLISQVLLNFESSHAARNGARRVTDRP
jgi:hypothetical protein